MHLEGDIFLIFWFVNSLPHFARVGNYSFLSLLKNLMIIGAEFDVLPDKSCPDRNLEGYVLLPLKD